MLAIFSSAAIADIKKCVGNNFEQQMPVDNVLLPTVAISSSSDSIAQGKAIILTAKEKVDNSGTPFFYWCAKEGGFEYDSTAVSDFRTVKYIAPSIASDKRVEITVQVGDSLGYIAFDTFYVNVGKFSQFVETIGNKQDGTVRIVKIDDAGQTSGLGSTGTVKVNGKTVQSNWTADGINLNIFSGSGITWNTLIKPVHVEVFD